MPAMPAMPAMLQGCKVCWESAGEEHLGVNRPPANCRPWLPWWIARDLRDSFSLSPVFLSRLAWPLWWLGTSHKSRTFYLPEPERMRRPFKAASWVCKLLPLLLPLPLPLPLLLPVSCCNFMAMVRALVVVAIALGHFLRGCSQGDRMQHETFEHKEQKVSQEKVTAANCRLRREVLTTCQVPFLWQLTSQIQKYLVLGF